MKKLVMAAIATVMATSAMAHDLGFAGLLDKRNRTDLAPITMASGKPLAEEPYMLKSGGYYRINIVADGSAEIAVEGPEFFRNVWVSEVVINDLEVRPMGISSFEFDDEGEIELTFIAIVPGRYELRIPGTTGETQRALFIVQ